MGVPRPSRRAQVHLLVVVSATATATLLVLPNSSPPEQSTPLLVLACAALGVALWSERSQPVLDRRFVLAVTAALLLVAVVEPIHRSADVWAYAMYGRIVSHFHLSPYVHPPSDFPTDVAYHRVAVFWRHNGSV